MNELDQLMAACRAAPEDDAPRLVWADAVGGERGELVVIQCRLANDPLEPDEAAALRRRQDELLAASGAAWSGFAELEPAKRCVFRRGFVDAIEVDIMQIGIAPICERAPLVSSLSVKGLAATIDYRESSAVQGPDAVAVVGRLLDDPALGQLRGIEIDGAVIYELTGDTEWDFDSASLADPVMERIAASGKLGGFRAFGLHDGMTARGIHELLSSNVLPGLERLLLRWSEISRDQIRDLLAATPRLRAFEIHGGSRLRDVAPMIPPSVVELRWFGSDMEDLAALAASPVAASIERLAFSGSTLDPAAFAHFPRLRSLDVGTCNVGRGPERQAAAIRTITKSSMPALRELRVFSHLTTASALALAGAYGGQLERLDCRGEEQLEAIAPALEAKVAGQVMVGVYESPETLLQVGINTREPWLRHGLVTIHK